MTDIKTPPFPTGMPGDRQKWLQQIGISNFINAYYQYKDVLSLGHCRKLLIVGPGQGLDRIVFQWRSYEVTTLDIDTTFNPDFVGSVHDMPMFDSGHFDAVIVSHVLEHFAEPYLDSALEEIARVGYHALIYLPVHGKHLQWRLMTGARKLDLSFIVDLYNIFDKADGLTARYSAGQHFWEIGIKGFKVKDIKKRISKNFEIIDSYRNRDWLPSYNFVLKSKFHLDRHR